MPRGQSKHEQKVRGCTFLLVEVAFAVPGCLSRFNSRLDTLFRNAQVIIIIIITDHVGYCLSSDVRAEEVVKQKI